MDRRKFLAASTAALSATATGTVGVRNTAKTGRVYFKRHEDWVRVPQYDPQCNAAWLRYCNSVKVEWDD